jgi:dUTP pyrophosphatase
MNGRLEGGPGGRTLYSRRKALDAPLRASARYSPYSPMQTSFTRLDRELPAPRRSHPGDAGVDVCARIDVVMRPGERALVPTGIAVAIPEGHGGFVVPRSGLAISEGVGVVNGPGLIDAGYRGEVKVILINHGSQEVRIARGDRIAQLVVVPVAVGEFVEVDSLPGTSRGAGGFGSTGR